MVTKRDAKGRGPAAKQVGPLMLGSGLCKACLPLPCAARGETGRNCRGCQPFRGSASPHSEVFAEPCIAGCLQLSMTKEQKEAGLASVFKRDDSQQKGRKEVDAREKDPAFVSDAYSECYPDYHAFGTTVMDDEDADFTHMDNKAGGGVPTTNVHQERVLGTEWLFKQTQLIVWL